MSKRRAIRGAAVLLTCSALLWLATSASAQTTSTTTSTTATTAATCTTDDAGDYCAQLNSGVDTGDLEDGLAFGIIVGMGVAAVLGIASMYRKVTG